jgi:hypothetical protein
MKSSVNPEVVIACAFALALILFIYPKAAVAVLQ